MISGVGDSFKILFMEYSAKKQRWRAEILIGEETLELGGAVGEKSWYVIGHPDVEVPAELCNLLGLMTRDATADCNRLRKYKDAVGSIPGEILH